METKFKTGDAVCYKTHPDICIGYVSSDISQNDFALSFKGVETHFIHIHTSDAWLKHFTNGSGPNSIMVSEEEIMLYNGDLPSLEKPDTFVISEKFNDYKDFEI